MDRDIETVIAILKRTYPSIAVQQLPVTHAGADDDGLWFFRHPAMNAEVHSNLRRALPRSWSRAPTPPLNASHR